MAEEHEKQTTGRKFFRIPLEDPQEASVRIKGHHYNVINVTSQGVGIYLENADTFEVDNEITDINLTINGKSCNVKGRIAHVTPTSIHYLCGLEIIDMDQDASELLKGFIDQHKASLFSFMS